MAKIAIVASFCLNDLFYELKTPSERKIPTWLRQLIEEFASKNIEMEFHWLVISKEKNVQSNIKLGGQYFYHIPIRNMTEEFLVNLFFVRRRVKKKLGEIEPDLVHCWGTENFNCVGLDVTSSPSILSMQGILDVCKKTGALKGWRWKKFIKWELDWIKKATLVTCESEWGMRQVQKIHSNVNIQRVEYGIYRNFYEVEWIPNKDRPKILFSGQLNLIKGVDILIEMIKNHPKRNWDVVFAGDGVLKSKLESLSECGIRVLGRLPFKELAKEMATSWALVLPSRADTSPNVVKEARVVGMPVIVSPNGGHISYVQDGVDGYVVSGEDPQLWYEKIDSLMSDFNKVLQMGKINQKKYREIFNPENTANDFIEIYQEMLRDK